jgi:hypothetical protein
MKYFVGKITEELSGYGFTSTFIFSCPESRVEETSDYIWRNFRFSKDQVEDGDIIKLSWLEVYYPDTTEISKEHFDILIKYLVDLTIKYEENVGDLGIILS